MIAILGQPVDTAQYCNREDYNVHPLNWKPDQVRAWIAERVEAGDTFQLVSTDFTGMYAQEIRWLREESYKLYARGAALIDRAREIDESIAVVSKRARAEQEGFVLKEVGPDTGNDAIARSLESITNQTAMPSGS